jgi:predicted transglutaminase-like cysteine proteinase
MYLPISLVVVGIAGVVLQQRWQTYRVLVPTMPIVTIGAGVAAWNSGATASATTLAIVLADVALSLGYVVGVLLSLWRVQTLAVVVLAGLVVVQPNARAASLWMKTGKNELTPFGFGQFCLAKPWRCRKSTPQVVTMTLQRWKQLSGVQWDVNHTVRPSSLGTAIAEPWVDEGQRGSCVLYANMKRSRLLDLGWPPSALLLTLVRVDGYAEQHIVLVVRTDGGDLVLESLGDGKDHISPYQVYRDHHWIMQMSPEGPLYWQRIISLLRVNPGAFLWCNFETPQGVSELLTWFVLTPTGRAQR